MGPARPTGGLAPAQGTPGGSVPAPQVPLAGSPLESPQGVSNPLKQGCPTFRLPWATLVLEDSSWAPHLTLTVTMADELTTGSVRHRDHVLRESRESRWAAFQVVPAAGRGLDTLAVKHGTAVVKASPARAKVSVGRSSSCSGSCRQQSRWPWRPEDATASAPVCRWRV